MGGGHTKNIQHFIFCNKVYDDYHWYTIFFRYTYQCERNIYGVHCSEAPPNFKTDFATYLVKKLNIEKRVNHSAIIP